MNVWLKYDRSYTKDFESIGKTYENNANEIRFHFDFEEVKNYDVYLEFEKSTGEKLSTSKLDIVEDYIDYAIPNNILDVSGLLKCEVVLRKDVVVWKSNAIYTNIYQGINASENYGEKYPDFIEEAQKILDECKKQNQIFIDTGDGTKFLADDGIYKTIKSGEEINVSEFQTVLENISGNKIGYDCETINEVLIAINRFYSKAKIVVNATDSVSGETLTSTINITGAEKEDDGYYYLMAGDTTWAMIVTCSGYVTQRIEFVVTDEEASIGIKEISVQMVART